MEFTEISNWLKETILGVVILGSLGSALCLGVFKLFTKLFYNWLPSGLQRYQHKRNQDGYYLGRVMGYFHHSDHTTGTVCLIIGKATAVISSLIGGASLLMLFFIFFLSGGKTLTFSSYLVLLLSIILLSYSAYLASEFRELYKFMLKQADDGLVETDEQVTNENSD